MTILWEAIPLATLAGTTVFCAWKWNGERVSRAAWKRIADRYRGYLLDTEDCLRRIERQRHKSAKHARSIQLQRQREQRDATTLRLKEGR